MSRRAGGGAASPSKEAASGRIADARGGAARLGRSLAGATVVLTRRPEDNALLARELRGRGAAVIELPCVRTVELDDPGPLAAAIDALTPDDLLVLTSRAGADAVAAVRGGRDVACPVAAVGEATAERASALGMSVCFSPSRADGRTLGRELPLPRGTVVLARSDIADGALPAALRARGAAVRDVAAYRTVARIADEPAEAIRAFERGPVTIVVASPSAVDALSAFGEATLGRATFVAIGPRTAARVRERLGLGPIACETTDLAAIARAIPLPAEGREGRRGPPGTAGRASAGTMHAASPRPEEVVP